MWGVKRAFISINFVASRKHLGYALSHTNTNTHTQTHTQTHTHIFFTPPCHCKSKTKGFGQLEHIYCKLETPPASSIVTKTDRPTHTHTNTHTHKTHTLTLSHL